MSKKSFMRFINPEHYLCFKYLYNSIIFSLSLVSIFIGINAGIFAHSEKGFFPTIREQFKLRVKPTPVEFDCNNIKSDKKSEYKFLYVLDRTKSTEPDIKDTAILLKMKRKILSYHRPDIQIRENTLDNLDIKDFALLYMLSCVKKNTQKSLYENPKYSVTTFNGTKTLDMLNITNASLTWTEMNEPNYIESINNFLEIEEPYSNQWTNFKYICEGLETMLKNIESNEVKDDEKVVLTIISDFVHEEINTLSDNQKRFAPIEEVDSCIKKLSADYVIYQVNLVCLPFNIKKIDKGNYPGMNEASIKYRVNEEIMNLKKLFRDNFNQVYYYEFNLKNSIFKNNVEQGFRFFEQIGVPVEPLANNKIVFYYPYSYMKTDHTARAILKFKNYSELYLSFSDCMNNRLRPELFYLLGNNPEMQYTKPISELNEKPFREDTLDLFCYTPEFHKQQDMNMEIFSPGKGIKKYCSISFKENLSKYYSFILVVCTTTLFFALLFTIILLIFFLFKRKNSKVRINLLYILIVLMAATIIWSWLFTSHCINWFIILLSFIYNSIALYLYSVQELDDGLSKDLI